MVPCESVLVIRDCRGDKTSLITYPQDYLLEGQNNKYYRRHNVKYCSHENNYCFDKNRWCLLRGGKKLRGSEVLKLRGYEVLAF